VLSGSGDGGYVAYDWQTGTIKIVNKNGDTSAKLVLPQAEVPARTEDYRVGATAPVSLSDMAVSADGTIWLARADNRTLWRLTGH
jgi:hypothetical protein